MDHFEVISGHGDLIPAESQVGIVFLGQALAAEGSIGSKVLVESLDMGKELSSCEMEEVSAPEGIVEEGVELSFSVQVANH